MNRRQRKALNAERVRKIHPALRPKIMAILSDMEGKGWQPMIDEGVYRTPAEQAEKKRRGLSKVDYSFHNVTGRDGTPEALAADIVDVRYGWNAPSKYWLQLASSAEAHGMQTGIRWGLSTPLRSAINALIRLRDWSAKYAIGWDAAHVEVKGITLSQAKMGRRPR
jgi:hypothetical protein